MIEKQFPDGFYAEDDAVELSFEIYQNEQIIGTFTTTVTKTKDKDTQDFTWTLTKWSDLDEKKSTDYFPRYDNRGAAYTYYVRESYAIGMKAVTKEGKTDYEKNPKNIYTASSETNSEEEAQYEKNQDADSTGITYQSDDAYRKFRTVIVNPTKGTGMQFRVYKKWLDDGERQYRKTVTFVFEKQSSIGGAWETVTRNKNNEPEEYPIYTNQEFVYVNVPAGSESESYNAWKSADCPAIATRGEAGRVIPAYRIREVKLGDTEVTYCAALEDENAENYPEHTYLKNYAFIQDKDQYWDVKNDGIAEVTEEGTVFTLTNLRVGVVTITVTKKWEDNKNTYRTRPDNGVEFTLSGTGIEDQIIRINPPQKSGDTNEANEDTNEANIVSGTLNGDFEDDTWSFTTAYLPKYTDTGKYIAYSVGDEQLRYKSTEGDAYKNSHKGNQSLYALEADPANGTAYQVGTSHTKDTDTFAFTNRLSDTVEPYMNKYWKDDGTSKAIASRPNIYGVLYRVSDKDKDGIFTEADVAGDEDVYAYDFAESKWDTEVKTRNWWKNTFAAQPRFDEQGRVYLYLIAEGINGSTNGYNYTRGYTNEPSNKAEGITGFQENGDKACTLTYHEKTFPVAPYSFPIGTNTPTAGTLVNKPDSGRTVTGHKVFENLPAGFNKDNLPDITFTLYRVPYAKQSELRELMSKEGNENGAQITASMAGKLLEEVTYENARTKGQDPVTYADKFITSQKVTAVLSRGEENFVFKYPKGSTTDESLAGSAIRVDKYDPDGMPYMYLFLESEPENMGIAYELSEKSVNGISAVNAYKENQGHTITLTKSWDFGTFAEEVKEGPKPTKATFHLYRYLVVKDENGSLSFKGVDGKFNVIKNSMEETFASEKTNGNANDVILTWENTDLKSAQQVTWTGLAYYAPNGNPYYYEVREECTDNVVAYNAKTSGKEGESPKAYEVEGNSFVIPVTTVSTDDKGKFASSATVVNVYGEKTGTIKVQKKWDGDTATDLNTRPASIKLSLYRTYGSSDKKEYVDLQGYKADASGETICPGENAGSYGHIVAKGAEAAAEFVIVPDPPEMQGYQANVWTCNISGLQIYAPDGTAYRYGVEEVSMKLSNESEKIYLQDTDYSNDPRCTMHEAVENGSGTVILENKLATTIASASKTYVFTDSDGNAIDLDSEYFRKYANLYVDLGVLPTQIKAKAFYRLKGEGSDPWKALTKGGKPMTVTLQFENATGTYSGGKIEQLPKRINTGTELKEVEYKFCESELLFDRDANSVSLPDTVLSEEVIDNQAEIDGMTAVIDAQKHGENFETTITNQVKVKKLTLRTIWDDDGNRDGYRPSKLNMKITRKGVFTSDDLTSGTIELESGDSVKDLNGKDLNHTAQGSNSPITAGDVWERTIYVPIYGNNFAEGKLESTYSVEEEYDQDHFTAGNYTSVHNVNSSDADSSFANVHTPWNTFRIKLEPKWSYRGISYVDSEKLPKELEAYRKLLQNDPVNGTLTYQLEKRVDNGDWEPYEKGQKRYSDELSWNDLPLYAHKDAPYDPNKVYQYRIVEGFVKNGVFTPLNKLNKEKSGSAKNFTAAGGEILKPEMGKESVTTITNTLQTKSVQLTKGWMIGDTEETVDLYGCRPESVTYRLQYTTLKNNGITKEVPAFFTKGVSDNESDIPYTAKRDEQYRFTLHDLPVYDPSGEPYIYIAEETSYAYAEGKSYEAWLEKDKNNDPESRPYYAEPAAAQGENNEAHILNHLNTRDYQAVIKWKDARKAENRLQKDIEFVTLELQHYSSASNTWEPVMKDGRKVIGKAKASAAEGDENPDDVWTYTWKELPQVDPVRGENWQYRAVEVSYTLKEAAGRTTEQIDGDSSPENGRLGAYSYQSEFSDEQSVIRNIADQVQINVTMAWRGEDILAEKTIKSARIRLQKRVPANPRQKDWTDALDQNGQVMEVTLVKDGLNKDTTLENAFKNLQAVDKNGNPFEYRCIQTGITLYDETTPVETTFAVSDDVVNTTRGTVGNYTYLATTLKHKSGEENYYDKCDSILVDTWNTTTVRLNAKWDDNHNMDAIRPKSVSFKILQNGKDVDERLVLKVENPTDVNQLIWERMPVAAPDGKTIYEYSVAELDAEGNAVVGEDAKYNEDYATNTDLAHPDGFTITNYHKATDLSFGVKVAYNEQNKRTTLNGAVFGFYTDEACQDLLLTAVSGKVTSAGGQPLEGVKTVDGQVHVHGILEPDTTYYVKQLSSNEEDYAKGTDTDNIVEDANVYTVTFNGQDTQGLVTKDGAVVINVIDDVNRSSIVVNKTDSNSGQPVAGATLGVFRRRNTVMRLTVNSQQELDKQEEWIEYSPFASYTSLMRSYKAGTFAGSPAMAKLMKTITENDLEPVDAATTDGNGQAVFKNLIAGQDYVVLDLNAADGYKPDAQTVKVTTEKDVAKTVEMKTEKTEMVIERKDVDGNLIGGFVVRIRDKDGNPVKDVNGKIIPDMTTKPGEQLVIPGLPDGEYVISDVEAPEGYELTEPVTVSMDHEQVMSGDPDANTFAIENGRVKATKSETQEETQKDTKKESKNDLQNVTQETQGTPDHADAKAVKTADDTPVEGMSLLMISALLMAIVLFRRKMRMK